MVPLNVRLEGGKLVNYIFMRFLPEAILTFCKANKEESRFKDVMAQRHKRATVNATVMENINLIFSCPRSDNKFSTNQYARNLRKIENGSVLMRDGVT